MNMAINAPPDFAEAGSLRQKARAAGMDHINEPRYPNFLGIRKAAKAQIPVWSAADLNIDPPAAATRALRYMNPPARDISTETIAGADVGEKAAVLVDRLFEEKVL
ncbi:MAG: hypothetical protein OXH27_04315 [Gammaproteobacteria bacterium]|nr:hypothetical protein [Gammaproteobacteria bacterium]